MVRNFLRTVSMVSFFTILNSSTQLVIVLAFYPTPLAVSRKFSIHFRPRKTLGSQRTTTAHATLYVAASDTRGDIILIVSPYALQCRGACYFAPVISILAYDKIT